MTFPIVLLLLQIKEEVAGTSSFFAVLFDSLAARVSRFLSAGQPVAVSSRLRHSCVDFLDTLKYSGNSSLAPAFTVSIFAFSLPSKCRLAFAYVVCIFKRKVTVVVRRLVGQIPRANRQVTTESAVSRAGWRENLPVRRLIIPQVGVKK